MFLFVFDADLLLCSRLILCYESVPQQVDPCYHHCVLEEDTVAVALTSMNLCWGQGSEWSIEGLIAWHVFWGDGIKYCLDLLR